jgi:hypothetical protein
MSETGPPGIRIYRPEQCREVIADEYALQQEGIGEDFFGAWQNPAHQSF